MEGKSTPHDQMKVSGVCALCCCFELFFSECWVRVRERSWSWETRLQLWQLNRTFFGMFSQQKLGNGQMSVQESKYFTSVNFPTIDFRHRPQKLTLFSHKRISSRIWGTQREIQVWHDCWPAKKGIEFALMLIPFPCNRRSARVRARTRRSPSTARPWTCRSQTSTSERTQSSASLSFRSSGQMRRSMRSCTRIMQALSTFCTMGLLTQMGTCTSDMRSTRSWRTSSIGLCPYGILRCDLQG